MNEREQEINVECTNFEGWGLGKATIDTADLRYLLGRVAELEAERDAEGVAFRRQLETSRAVTGRYADACELEHGQRLGAEADRDRWRRYATMLRERLARTQRAANEHYHEYMAAIDFYVPKMALFTQVKRDRDNARNLAVRLEGEVARLRDEIARMRAVASNCPGWGEPSPCGLEKLLPAPKRNKAGEQGCLSVDCMGCMDSECDPSLPRERVIRR